MNRNKSLTRNCLAIRFRFPYTLRRTDLFKLRGYVEDKTLPVGIACKGRWSFRGIGWDDILDEIGKFLIPVSDQILSKNPKVHCMLVILSTKLAYNVAGEFSQ
jgi:hypothetical protein